MGHEAPRSPADPSQGCHPRTELCSDLCRLKSIGCGTAVYLVALAHDAPGLAGQGNGPLELLSVGASLAIQLVVMVVVLVPAGVGAARARG
jgi:hypothetical protein